MKYPAPFWSKNPQNQRWKQKYSKSHCPLISMEITRFLCMGMAEKCKLLAKMAKDVSIGKNFIQYIYWVLPNFLHKFEAFFLLLSPFENCVILSKNITALFAVTFIPGDIYSQWHLFLFLGINVWRINVLGINVF